MNLRLPLVALAAAVSLLPVVASAHGINGREQNQRGRINRGVRSGELTRREASRLAAEQARIRYYESVNRRDGGGYTRRERIATQRKLNEASRDIFRQKHDRQDRG